MSPAKFDVDDDDQQHLRREINGSRPSPLKINKESHFIHKQPSSSNSLSSSMSSLVSSVAAVPKQQQQQQQQQQKQPIIIYTHSPKIIHTQARDFMALVQKLTGLSQSNGDEASAPKSGKGLKKEGNDHNLIKSVKHEDNESSSALTEDNSGGVGRGGVDIRASTSSSLSPILNPSHPYFADIPLFTPNSANFFCSPRRVYRYPESAYVSPNMGNSMSPSVLEFMKGLPEY